MNVLEALRTRRSIPQLQGEVDDATIARFVDLAVLAPNHRLTEPWLFTLISGETRKRLGRRWAESLADERGLRDEKRSGFINGEVGKLLRAPAILAVSTRTDPDPEVALEDYAATAAAIENLLLAAHADGLGAMWRTGLMASHPTMRTLLGLDPSDRIVGFVYLGIPEQAPPETPNRRKAEVFRRLEIPE
ncbi:MAG TPA: nitroreductase [Candidatus Baltobacteraceae bacterium]|jgi:nitroreductase|nr:nitroreductase [Candidatus Baltobacteraceae bacterium]